MGKIKVSELHPCDKCHGKIYPMFYVVRVCMGVIKPEAVNQFFGMNQFFQGRAPAELIENFAPAAGDAVIVCGDEEPTLMTEFFFCQNCYLGGSIDLSRLVEKRNEKEEAQAAQEKQPEIWEGSST